MSKAIPYIMTDKSITFMVDGVPITTTDDDPHWDEIIDAVRNRNWDEAIQLADKPTAVENFGKGNLKVQDGVVYYNDDEVENYVVDRIFDFINEKIDVDPLLNFMNKLMVNPSKRCVDELLEFLEHGNMPLDPDGDFYAYKAVTEDWMDKHSGTIRNQIGDIVEVARNQVDDDSTHACSHGLHAGSLEYVQYFGSGRDKFILVKINPKDVVSVPQHDDRKLRCCRYEVAGLYSNPLPGTIYND